MGAYGGDVGHVALQRLEVEMPLLYADVYVEDSG